MIEQLLHVDDVARKGAGHAHPALTLLTALLAVAVAVSVVHYADNTFNYAEYPQSADLPNPTAGAILASWFAFTAAGLAGYVLYRRGPSTLALVLLALYAGSGDRRHRPPRRARGDRDAVVAAGAVIADIICGIEILTFVLLEHAEQPERRRDQRDAQLTPRPLVIRRATDED